MACNTKYKKKKKKCFAFHKFVNFSISLKKISHERLNSRFMMTISVKSMYRFMARLLTYKFVQDIVVPGNVNFSRYLFGTGVDFCVMTTGSLPQKIQNVGNLSM